MILSSGSQAVSMTIIQSSPDLKFTQIYRALFTSFENQLLFMCKLMTNLLRFTVSPEYTVHFPFSFNDHYSGGLVEEHQAMMTFSWKFMTELGSYHQWIMKMDVAALYDRIRFFFEGCVLI